MVQSVPMAVPVRSACYSWTCRLSRQAYLHCCMTTNMLWYLLWLYRGVALTMSSVVWLQEQHTRRGGTTCCRCAQASCCSCPPLAQGIQYAAHNLLFLAHVKSCQITQIVWQHLQPRLSVSMHADSGIQNSLSSVPAAQQEAADSFKHGLLEFCV